MALINKPICAVLAILVWPLACGQADNQRVTGTGGGAHAGAGGKNAGGSASPGGDGGFAGSIAGAADGGASGGAAAGGSPTLTTAGSGGAVHSGGRTSSAGTGGMSAGNGGSVTQATGGKEGQGGAPLCARLGTDAAILSERVAVSYTTLIYRNCRVSGLYNSLSVPERIAAVNALNVFSIELWGCIDAGPTDFPLSLGAAALSRNEAEVLVTAYLDAVSVQLQPSVTEKDKLRNDVAALAETAITLESDAFIHSECGASGGAGGSAGAAGAAGAGGASASDASNESGGSGGKP